MYDPHHHVETRPKRARQAIVTSEYIHGNQGIWNYAVVTRNELKWLKLNLVRTFELFWTEILVLGIKLNVNKYSDANNNTLKANYSVTTTVDNFVGEFDLLP